MTKQEFKEVIIGWVKHDFEEGTKEDIETITQEILSNIDINKTTVPEAAKITYKTIESFKKKMNLK